MRFDLQKARNAMTLTLLVALVLVSPSLHSQSHCSTGVTTGCAGKTTPVSEVPNGAVDGTNSIFTLSSIPWPGAAVHVFDNGIEESSPADYQLKGGTIAFSSGHVPAKGDVINVFYSQSPNWPPTQGTSGPSNFQSALLAPTGEIAISQQLLRGAVEREIERIQSPVNRRSAVSAEKSGSVVLNMERPKEPRMKQARYVGAISMLERSLFVNRSVERIDSARGAYRDVSADGVEGLGDNYVPGPFDYLSSREDSELNQLLQASNGRGYRSRHISTGRGVPSAITMLADRLLKDGR